jgi:hypothetical protein
MRPTDKINQLIKHIHIKASVELDKRVYDSLANAPAKLKNEQSAQIQPILWRIIMKSNITKLTAAAVVILAVVLTVNVWDKFAPAAYAFEQTVRASHSVRYIHIKVFTPNQEEPKEFWMEFYENGQIKNARWHMPEWDSPKDGAKVVVWKEGNATVWFKKKNSLLIVKEDRAAKELLKMIEEFDPKLAVQRLSEKEKQGELEINIQQPADKIEPIIVTATSSPKSLTPNRRIVLSVNQATKLVASIEFYQLNDGEYKFTGKTEFHEYNQPIEEQLFSLDNEVSADVMRVDQTTQDIGLVQGSLTNEEIAVEVVRQFFEALIAEDYTKAGKLLEGTPADKMQQLFGKFKFLRIISIGPAGPHPVPETKGLVVPSTVEIEKDGQKEPLKMEHLGVRQVYNQPGRWTIFGGI